MTAGPKVLHVEIQVADDLPQDNRRSAALNIIERIKVLLVDGDPSAEWLLGYRFHQTCPNSFRGKPESKPKPKTSEKIEMKDLIEATSLTFEEFKKFNSLSEFSLVILANLQNLEAQKQKN